MSRQTKKEVTIHPRDFFVTRRTKTSGRKIFRRLFFLSSPDTNIIYCYVIMPQATWDILQMFSLCYNTFHQHQWKTKNWRLALHCTRTCAFLLCAVHSQAGLKCSKTQSVFFCLFVPRWLCCSLNLRNTCREFHRTASSAQMKASVVSIDAFSSASPFPSSSVLIRGH